MPSDGQPQNGQMCCPASSRVHRLNVYMPRQRATPRVQGRQSEAHSSNVRAAPRCTILHTPQNANRQPPTANRT
eukprot:159470-Chlamydomonas_euryale.AAC.1